MTSKTRAALTTEQTTNFADNTTGAITPAILRTTMQDCIDSFATQLDSSAFAGTAYSFIGSVAFSGTIAVGSAASGVFVSSAAGIIGGSTSTSSLILQSTNFGSTQTSDSILVLGASLTMKANASVSTVVAIGVAGSAYGILAIAGSTSGATTIAPPAAAGGTNTLQNATDTFVYLSTTDTLNNKTIGSALGFAGSTSGTMFVKATGAAGSGTLTLPAATDTLVGKATTDIFTNKTINAGSASTNTIQISGVTLGFGQYPGTTTNDNATAGNIGEFTSSTVLSGSAISLGTGTPSNVTSLSLTAGDWDSYGTVVISPGATTTLTQEIGWISSTSATLPTSPNNGAIALFNLNFPTGQTQEFPVGRIHYSFASTTTVFLTAQATFAVSACAAYGFIAARRVR